MYYELTEEQKVDLVDNIIVNDGFDIGYMEFTVIFCEITENISGFECLNQTEYDKLLDEFWILYEKKRNDYHTQPGIMFKDL